MNTLQHIMQNVHIISSIGSMDTMVRGIAIDSRKVEAGFMFVAIKGTVSDGHLYIDQAVANGATTIVLEQMPEVMQEGISFVQVADTHKTLGDVAAQYYGHPSTEITVVGVTGTNGKTTVATLLYRLWTKLGKKCGLISTVENVIGTEVVPTAHTTPDAVSIQSLIRNMCDQGITHVFMEVSSHAVDQSRIRGIHFAGGIFTNITHDHLDYHKTFEAYIKAKKAFFDELPQQAFALTNLDDKRGAVMLQNTKAHKVQYSLLHAATYKAKVLENNINGLLLHIDGLEVYFLLSGTFNAYNLLAVYGASIELGADKAEVLQALSQLRSASGRFETYRSEVEGVIGIVDYAHTPDALLNVLATIKQFDIPGKIITVVGCGGDRDRAKRPLMTTVAAEHSHQVILTSDNPRTEDPEAILADMMDGVSAAYSRKLLTITDRRQAIKTAVTMAQPGDVILIAGKGHEKYQEINGVKNHFDDTEELLNQFRTLEK